MTSDFNLWEGAADPPEQLEGQLEQLVRTCRDRGADYADVRFMILRSETYATRNAGISRLDMDVKRGLGLRVLAGGHWGFAAAPGFPVDEPTLIQRALDMARAACLTPAPAVRLRPRPAQRGSYRSPRRIDPASVPPEEKINLLLEADEIMAAAEGVRTRGGRLEFYYVDKWYADSEGSAVQQSIIESGGGISALAVGDGDAQIRTYPALMGDAQQAGWEFILEMDLPGHSSRVADEAVALLTAPECPSGDLDVIVTGSLLALQVHESCGHPSELDRVLGIEADVAGTSFLTPDGLGERRYGSPAVTLTADATVPGGLGTFGWDDEGTPAQRVVLVDEGIHAGYLTSRQYVPDPGADSGGNARCDNWARPPIVRMTNINLEPGSGTLDELIADTNRGYLLDGEKTWSIDDRRLNFTFGAQVGWEIVNGRLGRLLKNPGYTGITPRVWGRCDAVAGPGEWKMWGLTGCGKGAPMQNLHVGHGVSPARFRGLKVGVRS
ncbi:MAG: TldD/PmbA family protein [Bacillota bacterium]